MKKNILLLVIVLLLIGEVTTGSAPKADYYETVNSSFYDNPYGDTETSFLDICDQIEQKPLPMWRLLLHQAAGAAISGFYLLKEYIDYWKEYYRADHKRKTLKR